MLASNPHCLSRSWSSFATREIVRTEGAAWWTSLGDSMANSAARSNCCFDAPATSSPQAWVKPDSSRKKVAATLSSTGTRSQFLHPGEAVHGDLGRVHRDDVVLIFSQSGETGEVVRLLPALAALDVSLIAIGASRGGTLGRTGRRYGRARSARRSLPRWLWRQAQARRPCWLLAMHWRWSLAECEAFSARILPASILPAISGVD